MWLYNILGDKEGSISGILRLDLITEGYWTTVVLIIKGGRGYRGIGFAEFIWKVCASIMNNSLKAAVTLHDSFHGFIKGVGAGTATMDSKLDQNLAGLCHEPLLQVLLDVWKS